MKENSIELNKKRTPEIIEAELEKLEIDFSSQNLEENLFPKLVNLGLPEDNLEFMNQLMTEGEVIGLPEFLSKIPDELRQEVSNFTKEYSDYLQKYKQLTAEIAPYKKQEIEKGAKSTINSIDFSALFKNSIKDNYRFFEAYLTLEDGLDSAHSETFNPVSVYDIILKQLEKAKEDLNKGGFLLDKSPTIDIQERPDVKKIIEEVKKNLEELKEYRNLKKTYGLIRDKPEDAVFDAESELVYLKILFSRKEKIKSDPRFLNKLEVVIDEMVQKLRSHGLVSLDAVSLEKRRERIDGINEKELVEKLEIKGLEPREGKTLLVTAEQVRQELKNAPPDFLTHLKSITYVEKDVSDSKPGEWDTTGTCFTIWDKEAQEFIFKIEIYRSPYVSKDASFSDYANARDSFIGTLWHEIGHGAHSAMDYEEMREWEKLVIDDGSLVSGYVRKSRVEDEQKGRIEDFSESFRLFVNDPALLSLFSPERFKFMTKLCLSRMKSNHSQHFLQDVSIRAKTGLELLHRIGYTDEKIREIYLD